MALGGGKQQLEILTASLHAWVRLKVLIDRVLFGSDADQLSNVSFFIRLVAGASLPLAILHLLARYAIQNWHIAATVTLLLVLVTLSGCVLSVCTDRLWAIVSSKKSKY